MVRIKQARPLNLYVLKEPEACRGRRQKCLDQRQRARERFPGLEPTVEDGYVQSGDPRSLLPAYPVAVPNCSLSAMSIA